MNAHVSLRLEEINEETEEGGAQNVGFPKTVGCTGGFHGLQEKRGPLCLVTPGTPACSDSLPISKRKCLWSQSNALFSDPH